MEPLLLDAKIREYHSGVFPLGGQTLGIDLLLFSAYNFNMTLKKKRRESIKFLLFSILIAAVISFLLINYVLSAFKIEGDSMVPLLDDQQRIIVSKFAWRGKQPRRFEVVVLHRPDIPEKSVVKRIIGLPHEIIEIRKGKVFINYQVLPEPFRPAAGFDNDSGAIRDLSPLLIPGDHYFVLGDNRRISHDSRLFGTVPKDYLQAKAVFSYWPIKRAGKIK